jgi:phospholipid-translocating ATPase
MRWSDKVWDANVDFLVLPSMTTQIIIGLPHILLHFRQLFVAKILEYPSDEPNNSLLSIFEGAVQPWHDDPIAADAEEDIDHPCLFSDALHFMETGHEKALLEFRAQFDSHVSPEMKEQTNIYELLETKGAKVFVPQNWEGINRIEPIEFQWKADMPERMIPKVRPINPNSFQNSRTEVARLQGYFLVPSQSPIASPLVIAPKSTPPYIRVCGDYVAVNKYIVTGASVIPHVQKELEKIRGFSVFTDLDLTNSFHQLPLGPLTAEKLSLVTPWGQFRPKFLPEGVTPASGLLQKHVQEIFQDFADWTIVIFDNLLVLAHSHQDAYEKLDIILDRCIERNLFLKFAKSWIGVKEVKFFGYLCRHQSYGMTAERKDSILSAPMPTNTKQMQSFLGAALFFKSFVPDFSIYTAELHDMTKQNFDWNPSSWTVDYAAIFQRCKRALVNAAELVYPDYTLEWTLRVDASDKGVGAVLFQTYVDAGGNTMHQPISFTSKKFSDTAQRWHTFEKEAFGIYFGVHSNDYFLRGKPFLLETDHRNLLWIEKSQNPKVIRWLMYLQAFIFKVRHIAGIANSVADWASRIHFLCGTTQPLDLSRRDILHICHDDRSGHLGIKRTWHLIQQRYPEAGISMQMVADFVTECSVCQKVRTDLNTPIQPVVRHLAQPHHRSAIGIDVLSLPQDDNGNVALYVIRNVFTKLVFLEPTKTHSAESLASCLFGFYATFGLYDTIRSDPGSDLMADVVHILNSWFGIHHTVSLVGRHTSSGVEAANRQILRYLRCIFTDSSIVKRWSDSSIINWVQLLMNIYDDSETSISPFVATFGSSDKEYATVPSELTMTSANKFIATLDDDLAVVRSLVRKHQTQLVSKRLATNPTSPARYQPGDLVLLRNRVEFPPKSKLHPLSLGPYRVLQHDKNDVLVESLVDKRQRTLFVGDLLPFFGSHDEAVRMARRDDDQEVVVAILAHRGEPRQRRSMDFKVHFGDSSVLWLPWSSDIAQTIAYEMYINARPMLRPLRFTVQALLREDKILNASPITEVAVGTFAYVDLRWYGYGWFEALDLPDHDNAQYVVKFRYEAFNKERTVADIFCHIFKERWKVNHVFVVEYGMSTNFDATSMVLVDAAFVKKFPSVAKNVASRPPPRPSSGKTI